MPRTPRLKSSTGIYHVMFRGANRQEIFHDERDCIKFLEVLSKYKEKSKMKVYAWCLMNNHIHLLLHEGVESLSTTLKRIAVSFVYYYHSKYQTTGHLFQDRYRSETVESMKYLLTVIRYIHQNPVKAKMVARVDEWRWSSCLGYYGKDLFPDDLLDSEFVLSLYSYDQKDAIHNFKEFNEKENDDVCLEQQTKTIRRITDDVARGRMKEILGSIEIPHVKSLPRVDRNDIIRQLKEIEGISQRQLARILGISVSLINRA